MDAKFSFIVAVAIYFFLSFILIYLLFASFHMNIKFSSKVTIGICSYLGYILLNLAFIIILILILP